MAISDAQRDAILQGVAASDTVFYVLGGASLVVLAGIWGFYRVVELMGGRVVQDSAFSDEEGLGDESIFNSEDVPRPYLSSRAENEGWRD